MPSPKLNIVVALPCEARLFLDHYRLTRLENSSTYPIYANAERSMHLIVSGIGKIKSAAALSYLHALTGTQSHTCYLNAGIAGAKEHLIGECFVAHKITDFSSGKVHYPLPALIGIIDSLPVLTVDRPTAEYPSTELIEMEAAGFHQAALQFVTQEQVQTLKIISDNANNPMLKITPAQVITLFEKNFPVIAKLVDYLLDLSAKESMQFPALDYFKDFNQHFHFTNYQRHQLRELLRRWQINYPRENPLIECISAKTAGMAIMHLSHSLEKVRLCK
jgi:adenosylhomocysteine nucleosidase